LRFINYLYGKNFSDNYIHKILTTIRTMLNDATDRGLNENLAYKSKKVSVAKTEADNVYLNEVELDILHSYPLIQGSRLDKVRDLFLISTYTGLRFSDFTHLKVQNVQVVEGVDVFNITIRKMKDRLIIPIHPVVKSILRKWNDVLPEPISNQRMNDYLKELCELAGIDGVEIKREHRGGKMYEVPYLKYQLISSHTGRRSFATNAYKAGVPMLSIMRITGHSQPETFLKYIKFDNTENALLMAKHPFFQSR